MCALLSIRRSDNYGQLEKLITKNYYLHQSAKDGYRAYIQSYASYSLKKIFNVHDLDLAKVAKSFGFLTPPAVNIPVRGTEAEGAVDENEEEQQGSRARKMARSTNYQRREEVQGPKAMGKERKFGKGQQSGRPGSKVGWAR
jgi:ATP-dependent RNA helicase DDX18/HAS1